MNKIIRRMLLFILFATAITLPFMETTAKTTKVYRVPVVDAVEKGLYEFLQRSFSEAEEAGAEAIILDINTPGGLVDAAQDIAKIFDNTDLKVIAYVNNRALSAGAFLALYADEIYMSPSGTIGAAQVIKSDGNAADDKADSAWIAAMTTAAESSSQNRDVKYAIAMADAIQRYS